MRVFLTGATGFVGTAVIQELQGAGHQVFGLARSEVAASVLTSAGVEVVHGSLEDHDSLRRGVSTADAVIHTGFNHDFSRFHLNCKLDRLAIETLGAALSGSQRPLIVTSGVANIAPGRLATENDVPKSDPSIYPRVSEETAGLLSDKGVNAMVVRLAPSVHGIGDHGFVPILLKLAREKGLSAYIGDGGNRWPAVHRLDAAQVYRLALEKGSAGTRFHAVAEEGVTFKALASAIGQLLNIPVVAISQQDANAHFGWFAHFAGMNAPASSELTRNQLGWNPTQRGLLADIEQPGYFG